MSGKVGMWPRIVQFQQGGTQWLLYKPLDSTRSKSDIFRLSSSHSPPHLVMDAVERKAVRFSLPPLAPPFYNGHALWPEANRSVRVTNTSTLKVIPYKRPNVVRKGCGQSKSVPAATMAHSGRHDQSDKNIAARADGTLRRHRK